MKKKLYATALTVGAAVTLIAGNAALSTYAFANGTAPNVKVTGQHRQTEFVGEFRPAVPATKARGLSITPEKTSEDMSEDKAVDIARKALEEKFDVSLDGMKAFPIFCTREDMEGTFYFVSFADVQVVDAQRAVAAISGEMLPSETVEISIAGKNGNVDVYIAFVNSKTGEVVSAEKNPTSPSDAAAPTAPVDPAN
ncbi:MAG: hypothetical protein E7L01_15815 [Paenibacillus macerans]|uniref:Uncharacterized protein n=1 Tax=Paenibacillus macerans TaxID=44252 RepID=A0A091A1I7_PAEMA|nr:hypothetical protein [Paenibacillus macerans]KFN10156.1 hypothetical protein DJ90_583 [Paenibacillus macerans]MBS5914843.1 hypothetical protein [Paenibacillus macerans]MCY7558682.1 hypothetical protein [Paenibacillus macerans]MDU5945697.1 hypothetical protein [Paenibacillus macerans]MDU7474773.1 hypothetical protein [Paenibacillus macerans]